MSICPALAPVVGSATWTEFGDVSFTEKFKFDVNGAPIASPGRIDMNPSAVAPTAVTFNNTPVAPAGTAVVAPLVVATEPVSSQLLRHRRHEGSRQTNIHRITCSNTRTGSIVTTDDGALGAALARNTPPPPSDTAIAAPIAAHRLRRTFPGPVFTTLTSLVSNALACSDS